MKEEKLNSQNLSRLSTFEISQTIFGIEISQLTEVVHLLPFTPLPNSNEIYQGVFNLRGEIYPLVDISPILNLDLKTISEDDMVVLVNYHDIVMGILADKVHGIVSYDQKKVKNPTGIVSRLLSQFVQGILDDNNNVVHILDLERLFRAPRMLAYF